MKPIAQTFYINEPDNGAAGVYLTSVELFFQSKSDTYGVQVQIRPTDNGNPTTSVMPFGDIKLPSTSVKTSADASLGTMFTFSSPIFLQSATSYAIVIIPIGGNPDYNIWTAELGKNDVTLANTPIKTNNDTGTLFLSSNDIQFTSIMTEDIKFNIYVADFSKNLSGTAVFTSRDSDYLVVKEQYGAFSPKEYVVVSNSHHNTARFLYGSGTIVGGNFTAGEQIYQTGAGWGPSGNVSVTGTIYSIDTTNNTRVVKLINVNSVNGGFSSSKGTVYSKTTDSKQFTISSEVNDIVVTTVTTNTVSVPFSDIYDVDQMIYIGKEDRTYVQPSTIVSKSATSLTLSTAVNFSDQNAIIGRVRGDGQLYAKVEASDKNNNTNRILITLADVNSDQNRSFFPSKGQFLIGAHSGASANIISTSDTNYNTIIPQFAESRPGDVSTRWTFTGTSSTGTTADSSPTLLVNNVERELLDYERILMSRSNEYYRNNSVPSMKVYADLRSANGLISPIIDTAKTVVDVVANAITKKNQISGYKLTVSRDNIGYALSNTDNHNFRVGDRVVQRNLNREDGLTTYLGGGDVSYVSENEVIVTNVNGYFSSIASIQNDVRLLKAGGGANYYNNTNITAVSTFNEETSNNLKYASRYISKSVVLAEGQDAEDIRVYLTAYRPAGTDLLVYARIMNKEDPGAFDNKAWTLLNQITSPSLLSSSANKNDFIEIQYGFPTSTEITTDGVRISPPITRSFKGSTSVDISTNRIKLNEIDDLTIGDRIQYVANSVSSVAVNPLANGSYYYVRTKGLIQKTFNGSSAINSGAKTITIADNPYNVNDRLKYVTTATAVGGLSNNSWYYVKTVATNAITLSSTLGGDIISITAGSADTNHQLSVEYITLSEDNIVENPSASDIDLDNGGSADNNHYIITDDWITVSDLSNVRSQDYVYFSDATEATNQYFVGQVKRKSVTNKRNLQLITPPGVSQWPPFAIANASFGVIKNLQWATAGFINGTTGVVRYMSGSINGNLAVYDGYKTFAIKIVPVSDSTAIIPRVKDMRAIALQV